MSKFVGFRQGKVHEEQVVSEYYCGGCGYPVTDHDSFCPECGGAFRESNADDLESENAKLRELCADMRLYFERSLVMSFVERVSAINDIEDRMDDLGVPH